MGFVKREDEAGIDDFVKFRDEEDGRTEERVAREETAKRKEKPGEFHAFVEEMFVVEEEEEAQDPFWEDVDFEIPESHAEAYRCMKTMIGADCNCKYRK